MGAPLSQYLMFKVFSSQNIKTKGDLWTVYFVTSMSYLYVTYFPI